MSAQRSVLSQDLIIGRRYMVPAVRVNDWHRFKGWLPVIGPMHTDAEFVNFPWPHFHIDWRFAPAGLFDMGNWLIKGGHYGRPIQCPDRRGTKVIEEGPSPRRMTYKRDPGPFPLEHAKWLPALTKHMGCVKLTNGVCPHRGIPVAAMRREGDILTCPGHGLRFHAITGELVTS